MKNTAVLLLSSPMPLARQGVVAAISQFVVAHHGGVLHSDDHVDSGHDLLLAKLEWDLEGFDIPLPEFEEHFRPVAERFKINYHLALSDYRPKVAILVSAYDHCLADLLYRTVPASWLAISSRSSATTLPPTRWPTFTESHFICWPTQKTSANPSAKCWTCWGRIST
jgi:formyltetrahydrofolate hydrolase